MLKIADLTTLSPTDATKSLDPQLSVSGYIAGPEPAPATQLTSCNKPLSTSLIQWVFKYGDDISVT